MGCFDRLVDKHGGDEDERGFSSRKQFLALLAGILGGHHGLRQTVAARAPNDGAPRLLGSEAPARSTLTDATRQRPAALFVDFLRELIAVIPVRLAPAQARTARRDLKQAVRLIDATHLDLGLRMRRWVGLYRDQAAAKPHVIYDPRAQRPVLFDLTPARINDITAAKPLLPIDRKSPSPSSATCWSA